LCRGTNHLDNQRHKGVVGMSENIVKFGYLCSKTGHAGVFTLDAQLDGDSWTFEVREGLVDFLEQLLRDAQHSSEECGDQYWEEVAASRRQAVKKLCRIVEGARRLMIEDGVGITASYEAVVNDLQYRGGGVWEVVFNLTTGLYAQEVEIEG